MRKALRAAVSACIAASVLILSEPGADASDVIYSCSVKDRRIALTFDDGPHPTRTDEILDILAEYHVRATFFLVGENAEWFPEIVAREAREGHELGNHSYSHADLSRADYGTICREIDAGERAIWENFEYRPRLLRPPGGCYGDALVRAAAERDYSLVCWSVDTRDWAHTPVDVIVRNVTEHAGSGDILLFHDYIAGDSPTPAALRILIPRLLAEGYEFVTVSELMVDGGD